MEMKILRAIVRPTLCFVAHLYRFILLVNIRVA